MNKRIGRKNGREPKRRNGQWGFALLMAMVVSSVSAFAAAREVPAADPGEKMPRFAMQAALYTGFDIGPEFQWGALVDGYLRLSPRFSLGLRAGTINTVDDGETVPQIPLDLLFSWDFTLPSGRVIIPLSAGAGVSFLPSQPKELFIDMLTLETGVKIRLSKKVWLAVLAGSRALMFVNTEYSGFMPHVDFRLLTGPYVRF